MLRCSDGTYYVASTTELELRVYEHRLGLGARYTARRLPVTLVYACEFETVEEAYEREHQVKGWTRAQKEALIREDGAALPGLSERRVPNRGGTFPEALEGNGWGLRARGVAPPPPSRASGNDPPPNAS